MAARETHKTEEFLEAAFDFGQWIERHWKAVVKYAVGFFVVAILIAAVFSWNQRKVNRAKDVLAAGTAEFNKAAESQFVDFDALANALTHFESAEDIAGNKNPGPLATYYRGATLHRLGRNDEAIEALDSFVARADGDRPLDWAGMGLLTRLKIDAGDAASAVTLLEGIVGDDSSYPQDQVLLQLGFAQQAAGDTEAARASWQRVVDEFAGMSAEGQARTLLEQ